MNDVDVYGGRGAYCERYADQFGIQRRAVTVERAA